MIDRKKFKADKNSGIPAGNELSAWFSLPSPVRFAIVLMTMGKLNLVVNTRRKSEKNLLLVAK